jgi:hypothetical protein
MRKKFLAVVTSHDAHRPTQCKISSECIGTEVARGSNSCHILRIVFQSSYECQYKGVSTSINYILVWSKVWTPARKEILSSLYLSRLTQPPLQRVLALVLKWLGLALTTHPYLMPRLRVWEATQLPHDKVAGMKRPMIEIKLQTLFSL